MPTPGVEAAGNVDELREPEAVAGAVERQVFAEGHECTLS